MKLISNNLPATIGIEEDGSLEFIHDNYFYNIGTLDGGLWVSRQTVEDYENDRDNWEMIDRWIPENLPPSFMLLRGKKR